VSEQRRWRRLHGSAVSSEPDAVATADMMSLIVISIARTAVPSWIGVEMSESEWWESADDAREMDEPEWLEKWGRYTDEIVNFWRNKNVQTSKQHDSGKRMQ